MTLGEDMEPQLSQSRTPTQSAATEGAHPNSDAKLGCPSLHPASPRTPLCSPPSLGSREAPQDAGIMPNGIAASHQGQAGAAVQALEKGYF